MKRTIWNKARPYYLLCCTGLALVGCATAPQATLVAQDRLEHTLVVRQTSTAQALAALGAPSLTVKFDSGNQVWLYEYAAPASAPASASAGAVQPQYGEYVVLFNRDGIVQKIRRRTPE